MDNCVKVFGVVEHQMKKVTGETKKAFYIYIVKLDSEPGTKLQSFFAFRDLRLKDKAHYMMIVDSDDQDFRKIAYTEPTEKERLVAVVKPTPKGGKAIQARKRKGAAESSDQAGPSGVNSGVKRSAQDSYTDEAFRGLFGVENVDMHDDYTQLEHIWKSAQ